MVRKIIRRELGNLAALFWSEYTDKDSRKHAYSICVP